MWSSVISLRSSFHTISSVRTAQAPMSPKESLVAARRMEAMMPKDGGVTMYLLCPARKRNR